MEAIFDQIRKRWGRLDILVHPMSSAATILPEFIAYITQIRVLAAEIGERTAEDFGPLAEQKTPEDMAVWLELYSDRLFESEEFARLSLDIREDIEGKFQILAPEDLSAPRLAGP